MAIEEANSHAHEEGENYFVSMTDMMVGMLFIFIILLMSFALMFQQRTDEQTDKIQIAEDVAKKLDELERQIAVRLGQISEASRLRLELLRKIKGELDEKLIRVEVTPSGDVLRLTEQSVNFAADSAILSTKARSNVDAIADVLARVLPGYAVCRPPATESCRQPTEPSIETVFIEGHTDVTGADERNWILSAERAATTYRELVSFAPSIPSILNRHDEQILSISGYAATRPIDPHNNHAAWDANRRIDLRFVMDTDTQAGLEELQNLRREMRELIDQLLKRGQ